MMHTSRRLAIIGISFAVGVIPAACGPDSGSADGASPTSPVSTKPLSYFQDRVQTLFSGKSYTAPPTTAPKPEPGKKIWVVPYGLSIAAGALFAAGVQDAGKAIGWDVTVFDGKFDPNTSLAGVRQAIRARADGIITYGIDCPYVQAALTEAKAAEIPVIGVENYDCSELKPGSPSLQTGIGDYNQ